MSIDHINIEVCCYSIASAQAAFQAGADRIELCDNLFEGGTTPSTGTMKLVRNLVDTKLYTMIRPRGGDFLYTDLEMEAMLMDIEAAKAIQLDGIVLGVLKKNGTLDTERMKELIEAAKPLEITLHRAFDLTIDPFQALEDAIGLGVDRILTSGQKTNAFDGIPLIKSLVELAGDTLSIMPGSGINEGNVCDIISQTGAHEFHVSAKNSKASLMEFKPAEISLGDSRFSEYSMEVADAQRITHYRQLTKNLVNY